MIMLTMLFPTKRVLIRRSLSCSKCQTLMARLFFWFFNDCMRSLFTARNALSVAEKVIDRKMQTAAMMIRNQKLFEGGMSGSITLGSPLLALNNHNSLSLPEWFVLQSLFPVSSGSAGQMNTKGLKAQASCHSCCCLQEDTDMRRNNRLQTFVICQGDPLWQG